MFTFDDILLGICSICGTGTRIRNMGVSPPILWVKEQITQDNNTAKIRNHLNKPYTIPI